MLRLEINGREFSFHFGMGFLKEINSTVVIPIEGAAGAKQKKGLQMAIAGIIDGDVETLADVLYRANFNQEPRITRKELDDYIEDEGTDVDELFKSVLDFFGKANCTRKTYQGIQKAIQEQAAKRKA